MAEANRREVFASLASRFKKTSNDKPLLVRPPYNKDSSLFCTVCVECVEKPCVDICEENIIKLDGNKIPFLSFEKNGCTFCDECAKICPTDVLIYNEKQKIEAIFKIDINSCLAWNSVMCSSCKDVCYEDAIAFLGVFRPTIDMSKCTGCGFCYSVCPPYSIKYEAFKES